MKQNLLPISVSAIALAVSAMLTPTTARGESPVMQSPVVNNTPASNGVTIPSRKHMPPVRSEDYPDDIDFKIRVDYNPSKMQMNGIICYNDLWSFVVDEVDLGSDGYYHVTDIPGEYMFIAIFTHADHDGTTLVVKEKVNIEEGGAPVVLDAYEATQKVEFNVVTSDGSPFEGKVVNGDDVIERGAIYTGYGNTEIYHSTEGQLLSVNFFLDSQKQQDGKLFYGPREGDIYINDLGEDSELSIVQVRLGRSERGFEIAKLQAQGVSSQTVTNSTASYLNLKNNFAPQNYPNTWVEAGYAATESMGYVSVWQGKIADNQVLNAIYQDLHPNMDMIYVSAPPADDPKCDFQIIPLYGSFEDSGDNDFSGRGTGIFLPFMLDNGDGTFKVLDNAAANGFWRDEWTKSQEYAYPNIDAFNPYLEYYIPSGSEETWGNSVPIVLASIGYRHNTDSRLRFAFIGRKGENRYIDNRDCKFKMTADGEVISERAYYTSNDFEAWRMEDGDFRSTRAEYVITIEDNNIIVDGIQGYNKTRIYYDSNMTSANPPALRSLQFRDGDGNLTDRLKTFEDAVVEFYAGDFEMGVCDDGYSSFFNYGGLNDALIEYAPHGTDEWRSLYAEEVPELFAPIAYGSLYRAPLSDVTAESESGWYDLKIKLYDNNDNYQIQELSPAFKLEEGSGVRAAFNYRSLSGQEVEVYDTRGLKVFGGIYDDVCNIGLTPGVYIVKTMGEESGQCRKLIINQ